MVHYSDSKRRPVASHNTKMYACSWLCYGYRLLSYISVWTCCHWLGITGVTQPLILCRCAAGIYDITTALLYNAWLWKTRTPWWVLRFGRCLWHGSVDKYSNMYCRNDVKLEYHNHIFVTWTFPRTFVLWLEMHLFRYGGRLFPLWAPGPNFTQFGCCM